VRNLYVTPPLSLKNQWRTHYPRRGLTIMEIDKGKVQSYAIRWYTGIDPRQYKSEHAAQNPPASRLTRTNVIIALGAFLLITLLTFAWDIGRWLG
jgi:hypothetical protein